MASPLEGRRVVLGVTGSIACFKAVDLASKLTQAGAAVDVVLTRGATNFLTPLTFRQHNARPGRDGRVRPAVRAEHGPHRDGGAGRGCRIIAPATANTMAKLAWGFADDALTTTVLATEAPVIVAPAMDANMYENAATQENVERLRKRGVVIAGPARGRMASGLVGRGRMVEPAEIIELAKIALARNGSLANRKIVVSAGGTEEPLDPVRVIANRSSGKMGFAIAEAARDRGASAVIVSAPTALAGPGGRARRQGGHGAADARRGARGVP